MPSCKSRTDFQSGSRELDDLLIVLICALAVPLVWLVALGWHPGLLNSRYDNIQQLLPYLGQLFGQQGDWRSTLYRIEWLGGSALSPVAGTPPLYLLAAKAGLSTLAAVNLAGFLTQFAYAFLGTRLAVDLMGFAEPEPGGRPSVPWLIGAALLLAFVPMLGWRFAFGDALGLFGGLAFIAFLALYVAALRGRSSLTLTLVAIIAFTHAFPSLGQQHILYGAVFGLPVLIGAAFMAPTRRQVFRALPLPILVLTGSLLLVLPSYAEMLIYAIGGDSPRQPGGAPVIYTSLVATFRDWIASLTWFPGLIDSGRPPNLHHETNYPLGPFLFLPLMLVRNRALRPFLIGAAVSALLALALASNIAPFSTGLLALVPPLKLFRVPARAIRPAYFLLPVLSLLALELRLARKDRPRGAQLVAAAGVLLWPVAIVLPELARELIVDVAAAAIALWPARKGFSRWLTPGFAALAFGAMSVHAFGARLFPYSGSEELLDFPRDEGAKLNTIEPRLRSPLTRAVFHTKLFAYDINTPLAYGTAALEGYWHAPRRFGELYLALKGRSFDPTYLVFSLSPPGDLALEQLYNACCTISLENGNLRSDPLVASGAGEAWFSSGKKSFANVRALADGLIALGPRLAKAVHRELWLEASDRATRTDAPTGPVPTACRDARVISVEAASGSQLVKIGVSMPHLEAGESCPLTVPMNFVESLVATGRGTAETRLRLFPAYGALTAMNVPPETREVTIEVEPRAPPLVNLAPIVGALLIAAGIIMIIRRGGARLER